MRASVAAALACVLAHTAHAEVACLGQCVPVSFNDPIDGDTDSRDVTIYTRSDGDFCFVYTSENTNGLPDLDGEFDDWRIWKTCGVFAGQTLTNELVSPSPQPADIDYSFAQSSNDGRSICYFEAKGSKDVYYVTDGEEPLSLTDNKGEPHPIIYCALSADGSTVVYTAKDTNNVYQALMYRNGSGHSPTVFSEATTEKASWPRVNADGNVIVYLSEHSVDDPQLGTRPVKYNDVYMYQAVWNMQARITNLAGKQCNRTDMYARMVKEHGEDVMVQEGITGTNRLGNSQTVCKYYAARGILSGAGTIDPGDNGPDISGDGRFVVYSANYDLATMRGTHEAKSIVSGRNLFLFDAFLGITWQLTKEDTTQIEAFCCPSASRSMTRGYCSSKNQILGFCCWQSPCWHPTVVQKISTDGKSIVFYGDISPDGLGVSMDWDVFHYYIPTSQTTRVTRTSDKNLDDFYADISANGDVIAWTSDYDYGKAESITSTNQIMASKLALGCSLHDQALNYLPSPDVEVCCEFDESVPTPSYSSWFYSVTLQFNGNAADMLAHVPFNNPPDVPGFCSHYAETVRQDIACSLAVPRRMIEVATPSCARWGTDGIEVEVRILTETIPSAQALSAELVAQVQLPDSRIWKGYLTKTLASSGIPMASPPQDVYCGAYRDGASDADVGEEVCFRMEKAAGGIGNRPVCIPLQSDGDCPSDHIKAIARFLPKIHPACTCTVLRDEEGHELPMPETAPEPLCMKMFRENGVEKCVRVNPTFDPSKGDDFKYYGCPVDHLHCLHLPQGEGEGEVVVE